MVIYQICFLSLVGLAVLEAVALRREEKPTHHDKLSGQELMRIFGVTDRDKVPNYHPVYIEPKSSSIPDVSNPHASIVLDVFGTKLRLNVTLNKNFVANSHTIEFYGKNGKVEKYQGLDGSFSHGFVHGHPDSKVVLQHTGRGVSGSIRTGKNFYIINPLPQKPDIARAPNHVIFRRTDLPKDHPLHQHQCDEKEGITTIKTRSKREKREAQIPKTMEVMMAADDTMVKHYGREFLPSYILAVANIVSGIYKDSSLSYNLNLVVTRTVIFETKQFEASTINELLSKFSSWVQENNKVADENPEHVDNAILLTRNGCADGCQKEGLAYSSLCGLHAQSVNKDRGLMTALTVAHEVAHNLGLGHDGGSSHCPDGKNIMATGAASGTTVFQWSNCSDASLKAVLESSESYCFNDEPASHYSNVSFQLYGQVFDADKQCEFTFGSTFGKCSFYESHCDALFCQDKSSSSSCIRLTYPPVHGTYCGPNKWCINGFCVPDGTKPPTPVDGGWGEWGDYVNCNQDCGVGVQWRERNCTNPTPAHGGANCIGDKKGHFKTCNTNNCPAGTPSFRLKQCQAINPENKDFYDGSRPCQLVCGSVSEAYYFGKVADGTKCYPGSESNDVCIDGECQTVGCDLQINSGNVVDRCGVCKGSGSTCQLYTGNDSNPYSTQGIYHLTDIPEQSLDITVKEVGGTFNFLGFKVGNNSNLAISLPSYSATYDLEGTKVYYNMEGWYFPDEIRIIDKIPVNIKIFLVNYYLATSEGVTWRYYGPITTSVPDPTFIWKTGDWSSCSKTCSGGIQTRLLTCTRADDNSPVSAGSCSAIPSPPNTQPCNTQNCPAHWHLTAWTSCSKSCGNGTRTRQLYCSIESAKTGTTVVPDEECPSEKPIVTSLERCNLVHCPAEWRLSPWGECSKTCEGGIFSRDVICQRLSSSGVVMDVNQLECSYEKKPETTEPCNSEIPCPAWTISYSPCSVTCGEGLSSPKIICVAGEEILEDKGCDAISLPALPESKLCDAGSCASYRWIVRQSVCSATCGEGLASLSVICQRKSDNFTVEDALCTDDKPNEGSTKECFAGACPEIYEWKQHDGECSKTCGGGIVTRTPYCKRKSDGFTVEDALCDASTKPSVTTTVCAENACPVLYWYAVQYGECSVTCSNGVQVASAVCKRQDNNLTVAESACSDVKRPELVNKTCNMGSCPPTYSWKVLYSSCSVTCGSGSQSASVVCKRDIDSQVITDDMCDPSTKPKTNSKPCVMEDCMSEHHWKPTYGHCVASCGTGSRLKVIDCIERSSGHVVASSYCKDQPLPADESCHVKPCVAVFNTTGMPPVYALGCYNDIPLPRRVANYIEDMRSSYHKNKTSALIEKCGKKAHSLGYQYFSLQNFGECWAGDASTSTTYYNNGVATSCTNGVGGAATNFVYKIGDLDVTKSLPAVVKLGCFKDDLMKPRPLPEHLDNFRHHLDWSKISQNAGEIISKCASSTYRRSWSVFGVQYFGECWSGEIADKAYNRGGGSKYCKNGVGTINEYYVYRFYEL